MWSLILLLKEWISTPAHLKSSHVPLHFRTWLLRGGYDVRVWPRRKIGVPLYEMLSSVRDVVPWEGARIDSQSFGCCSCSSDLQACQHTAPRPSPSCDFSIPYNCPHFLPLTSSSAMRNSSASPHSALPGMHILIAYLLRVERMGFLEIKDDNVFTLKGILRVVRQRFKF